jgi:hypothetical protein
MFKVIFAALCATALAAPKVNVTLFSESLCPDCQHYITTSWWDLWNTKDVGGANGIINWGQYIFVRALQTPHLAPFPSSCSRPPPPPHLPPLLRVMPAWPLTAPSPASTAQQSAT